jgi:hypothetical protein
MTAEERGAIQRVIVALQAFTEGVGGELTEAHLHELCCTLEDETRILGAEHLTVAKLRRALQKRGFNRQS